jgi:predicted nucleotide-binding protein
MSDNIKKITIQDKEYNEAELPVDLQKLISIYRKWTAEATEAKLEITKIEAACKELSREIVKNIEEAGIQPIS